MTDEFSSLQPLPSKDQYETSARPQEHALGGVVEPRSSLGPRFHLDRLVEFDASAPARLSVGDTAPTFAKRVEDTIDDDSWHHHDVAGKEGEGAYDVARDDPDDPDDDADDADREHPLYERRSRQELLRRDRFERQVERERVRRERLERRGQRTAQPSLRRSRRPLARTGNLGGRHERPRISDPQLRGDGHRGQPAAGDRRPYDLSGDNRSTRTQPRRDVGTDTTQLSRPLGARVHGTALVLYFALLPYVVLSKWQRTSSESSGSLIRALLVVLALFWLGFLCQVIRNVWRLRQGRRVSSGGSAWLAGLVVAM
jgi:hypothetical protein